LSAGNASSSIGYRPPDATLGFSDKANLDEGHMWPTAFALKELAAADEAGSLRW
jgi:hypothetical protein